MAVVESTCGLNLTGASSAVCVCKGAKEKVILLSLPLYCMKMRYSILNNLVAEILI